MEGLELGPGAGGLDGAGPLAHLGCGLVGKGNGQNTVRKNLSSFSTWLYRIAYNVFYDYLRTRKETDSLETRRVDAQYSTQQNDIGRHMDIYRALNMLKETERTCITLFYMEDQSIEKIADITGYPTGTVKSHLSRAKEKMATYLKQNGYDGKQ
jgi:RNA polymerase sigma-70 factor (ECF subfamily)